MSRVMLLATLICCSFMRDADAETVFAIEDGNALFLKCQGFNTRGHSQADLARFTYCQAYITGIAHSLSWHRRICPISGVTTSQFIDVVVDYLQRHPEKRHGDASWLVGDALIEKFPCE